MHFLGVYLSPLSFSSSLFLPSHLIHSNNHSNSHFQFSEIISTVCFPAALSLSLSFNLIYSNTPIKNFNANQFTLCNLTDQISILYSSSISLYLSFFLPPFIYLFRSVSLHFLGLFDVSFVTISYTLFSVTLSKAIAQSVDP